MLSLAKRPCKIGSSINTRTEKHGDEDVPACDIPLSGLMLSRDELDTLLGPGAHEAFFRQVDGSFDVAFKQLKSLALRNKFEQATVELAVVYGGMLRLSGVRLARITLKPVYGGLTELSLQVQATPDVEEFAPLLESLNSEVEAAVHFGKLVEKSSDKQADLALSFDGASEAPDADEPGDDDDEDDEEQLPEAATA